MIFVLMVEHIPIKAVVIVNINNITPTNQGLIKLYEP